MSNAIKVRDLRKVKSTRGPDATEGWSSIVIMSYRSKVSQREKTYQMLIATA